MKRLFLYILAAWLFLLPVFFVGSGFVLNPAKWEKGVTQTMAIGMGVIVVVCSFAAFIISEQERSQEKFEGTRRQNRSLLKENIDYLGANISLENEVKKLKVYKDECNRVALERENKFMSSTGMIFDLENKKATPVRTYTEFTDNHGNITQIEHEQV